MNPIPRTALAAALLLAAPQAQATCTVKQQQTKIDQITALARRDPARAPDLQAKMHQALLLEGDEICAGLDRAIAPAK